MAVATVCPGWNSPPGASSTVPTASMPSTRGNSTPGEWPCRVKSSERLRPNAFTRMRTHPPVGLGTESSSILSTSGAPGSRMTAAFMVLIATSLSGLWCRLEHQRDRIQEPRWIVRSAVWVPAALEATTHDSKVVCRHRDTLPSRRECHLGSRPFDPRNGVGLRNLVPPDFEGSVPRRTLPRLALPISRPAEQKMPESLHPNTLRSHMKKLGIVKKSGPA